MNHRQFLQQVTSFIRSKDAKQHVEQELNQHLLHAKNAWIAKGYDEKEAEKLAVQHMGSPMTLGKSLGKLHKPKVDWLMIGLVALLFAMSFLPLIALNNGQYSLFTGHSYVTRNLLYIGLSILVIAWLMLLNIHRLENYGYALYGLGIGIFMLLNWFPNRTLGGEVMLEVGRLKLTIWYVLPIFCVAWAALFSKKTVKLWKSLLLIAIAFFFISSIANLSVMFIFCVMTVVMLLLGHYSRKQKIAIVFGIVALFATIVIATVIAIQKGSVKDYQIERLLAFLRPEAYADTSGYLNVLSKKIVENAQWFSGSDISAVPAGHTDLVFVYLIQSYGLAVALVVAVLLLALIVRMGMHSVHQPRSFAKLLIIGASTLFATQVLYALAMAFGLVPIVSIPLPFISYGFTSTIINACLIGLVLSVYRRKSFVFKGNLQ